MSPRAACVLTPRTLNTITASRLAIVPSVTIASPTPAPKPTVSSPASRTPPSAIGTTIATGTSRRARREAGSSPLRKATAPRSGRASASAADGERERERSR